MPHPTIEPAATGATIVPEDLVTLVQQGSAALQAGQLDAAIASFQEVVSAFPDRPEGHNNLGALYTSLGRLDQAEACFDRVLDLLPDNPNIHYNRGLVRARQEKFEAARLDFEAVLAHDPQDADARNNLGVAAYLQGQADEAREHFSLALGASPDHGNALTNLCDLEAGSGRPERSVDLCDGFLARRNDQQIRRKLVEMLGAVGSQTLERACNEAETVLAAHPGDTRTRQELGRLIKARNALAPAAEN